MIEISLNIVLWNGEQYLADLFNSIRQQTYTNFTVRLLDNGSTDDTIEYVRANAPEWLVGRNTKNLGFARGHNQLMTAAMDRFASDDLSQKAILIGNQDMVFDPAMIERLATALEAQPTAGAVQPKLLRAFSEPGTEDGLPQTILSDVLDTTGLVGQRNWRLKDRGAGEQDRAQYDTLTDVIGPGGALAAYRASALADVAEDGEYFDGDFNTYREDCDLALRLRRRGYATVFVPEAKGWHHRGMYGAAKRNLWQRLQDRRLHGSWRRAMSTRNQLFVLIKNLSCVDGFLAAPWIIFNEGGRMIYTLFFEGETRRLLFSSVPLLGKMLHKRRIIFKQAKESPAIIRAYMR